MVKRGDRRRRGGGRRGGGTQPGIISRDLFAFVERQRLGDRDHLRVDALAVGVEVESAATDSRGSSPASRGAQIAVAFALQAVAGHAGVARPARPARQRDHFAVAVEGVAHVARPRAARDEDEGQQRQGARSTSLRSGTGPLADGSGWMNGGGIANEAETVALRCRLAMTALLLLAACKPPTDARWPADPAAAKRGLAVIERVQCAACHEIDGVDWPKGRTGPPLLDYRRSRPDRGRAAQPPRPARRLRPQRARGEARVADAADADHRSRGARRRGLSLRARPMTEALFGWPPPVLDPPGLMRRR